MANPDVRWQQRLQSFRKAHSSLSGAAALSRERKLTDLEQQGLIRAFEFTFELGWKVLKDYLEFIGFSELRGPKPVVRTAFAHDVIEEGEDWIAMIESRNRTSHTHNEETAVEIATAILTRYVPAFDAFLRRFTEFEDEEP
ncbi:MAG: nucleotidyltransferase substrate binding protein [Chthoniobacterales bacterium]